MIDTMESQLARYQRHRPRPFFIFILRPSAGRTVVMLIHFSNDVIH